MTKESNDTQESVSIISGIMTVIFVGVLATSLIGFVSLPQISTIGFDLNKLYANLSISGDSVVYGATVLGWAVGGMIGGIRTKKPDKGFIVGFFGSFLGGFAAFLLGTYDIFVSALETFNFEAYINIAPAYIIGLTGITIAAALTGSGAGKVFMRTSYASHKQGKARKGWLNENAWKCRKCGVELPPGVERCPNCGYGAY